MQPSISVTPEPGSEGGVPWGCDLFTFVTSAAGHMMRTLQKPRKNIRSKRKVNHRRFLYNMIQRKFADIEAANHRLASALYFKEERKNESSLPTQEPETVNQSGSPSRGDLQDPDTCTDYTGADDISISRPDICNASPQEQQSEPGHHWKLQPKSPPNSSPTPKNNQSRAGQHKASRKPNLVGYTSVGSAMDCHQRVQPAHTDCYSDDGQLTSVNNLSEDSQSTQQDLSFIHTDQNVDIFPVFSPQLCPLSLGSCDFSVQMFTDISTCTQAHMNITDIPENQWSDIMDLFDADHQDLGTSIDVEAYFESICAPQGDVEWKSCADNVGCSGGERERMCSNSSEMVEYGHDYGFSCHGDQGPTVNRLQSASRQREDNADTQPNNYKPSQCIIQNQLHAAISCDFNVSEVQTHQQPYEESPCMLLNNQSVTLFEGVAQSFSVPLLNPEPRFIPTPPPEENWRFTDILKDRA